jgi:hypothetical protein
LPVLAGFPDVLCNEGDGVGNAMVNDLIPTIVLGNEDLISAPRIGLLADMGFELQAEAPGLAVLDGMSTLTSDTLRVIPGRDWKVFNCLMNEKNFFCTSPSENYRGVAIVIGVTRY